MGLSHGIWLKGMAALAVATAGSVVWLATRGPTVSCGQIGGDADQNTLSPIEVVASPWYGPHQVYGLFLIPDRFARGDTAATVKVADYRASADVRRGRTRRQASRTPSIPGHYPKRVYLQTRIALRLLVTGRFGDVRAACNWTLEVAE